MVRSSAHSAREFLMLGMVTYHRILNRLAPSIRAASYWLEGTDCSAAYKSRNTKGALCHMSITRSMPKAVRISENQL